MKKVLILSILASFVFSSSIQANRWEDRDIQRHNHKKEFKRVDNRHIVRPHRRVIHRPYHAHIRRPHHFVVRLSHRLGHRIHRLHHNAYRLSVGGLGYHYYGGAFYRPYRSGYRVVMAPIGAIVHSLPLGYVRVHINNRNYYRYEDTYYAPRGVNYCVVEAPTQYVQSNRCDTNYQQDYRYQIGDVALNLPVGAEEVIIDGMHYYEYENQYFRPSRREGQTIYTVVDLF